MTSNWNTVRLGEVVDRRQEKVFLAPDVNEHLMGVRWKNLGAYERGQTDTTPTKAKAMFRMREGDFVFNRIDTDKGAFCVVGPEMHMSVASNEFPAYVCDPKRLNPNFLWLHFQQKSVLEELRPAGSDGRARWKENDFERHPLNLPPLSEQLRVVDLFRSLDETIAAVDEQRKLSAEAAKATLAKNLGQVGPLVSLGDVVTFAGGYAFPPAHQGQNSGAWPFYKVSDMNLPGNEMTMSNASHYVSAGDREALRFRVWPAGTVVFPKVGAALLTEKRRILSVESTFDNNIMGLVAGEQLLDAYLFAFMQTIRLGDYAQTGAVPSINQSHIVRIEIPLPSIEIQGSIVEEQEMFNAVTASCDVSASALRTLRSEMLTSLLSGAHTIPESYDEIMVADREAVNA